MEKIGTGLRTLKRRLSRKSSYDLDESDPVFKVSALSNGKGIRVFGTEPLHARQAVHQMMDLYSGAKSTPVSLVLSGKTGVGILDKHEKVLINYDITEIVICFADKLYEDVFVFIGDKGDEIRCQAFQCGSANRAQLICLTMAKMFQIHFDSWARDSKRLSDTNQNIYVERITLKEGLQPLELSPDSRILNDRRGSLPEGPHFSRYQGGKITAGHEKANRRKSHNDIASTTCRFLGEEAEHLYYGSPDSVEGIGEWYSDSDNECLLEE